MIISVLSLLLELAKSRNVASLRAPCRIVLLGYMHGCYASEIELLVLVPRVLLDLRPRGIIVSLRNRMAGRRGRQNACACMTEVTG